MKKERISFFHDGKNLICKVSDSMNYRKVFLKDRLLVWVDEGRGMPGEYYIIQSKGMSGEYICPSCGYKDTLENLIDGCDYCGTKFQIEDFKEKVSSIYRPNSATQRRDGFTIYKNFWPLYLILVIIVMALFSVTSNMGAGAMMLAPVMVLFLIVIFLAVVFGKSGKESVAEGPARNAKTLEQLREVEPQFSEEAFIGNLSNKLMSIYYAERMEDIRPFAECDMTPLLQARRGVIDCRLLECVLMEYRADNQYQCLDVKVKAGLTVLGNGSVFRTEEHLRLYMIRSVNAVTQSMNDVNVYKCDSCGAVIVQGIAVLITVCVCLAQQNAAKLIFPALAREMDGNAIPVEYMLINICPFIFYLIFMGCLVPEENKKTKRKVVYLAFYGMMCFWKILLEYLPQIGIIFAMNTSVRGIFDQSVMNRTVQFFSAPFSVVAFGLVSLAVGACLFIRDEA